MSAYSVLRAVLRPVLRRGFRWTIEGVDRIPREGPVIIAANHISHLDPLCLQYLADLRGRRLRFLAKAELFAHPLLGPVLRAIGDIPVGSKGSGSASPMAAALAALADGEAVGIFPEGAISTDFEPLAARTGVARLAAGTGASVVPVGLWGGHRVSTRGRRRMWRPGLAQVAFVAEPMPVDPAEDPREATDRIMAAICAGVSRAREAYPDRPGGEESPWWYRPPETAELCSCRNLADEGEFWPEP